jgi:hypothetical protein
LFATSKKSRKKWVTSLTSERELTDAQAGQIAWASFPFNDKERPKNREFEKAVRGLSWEFLGASKRSGLEATHSQAIAYLGRFADLAALHGEPYYGPICKGLVRGDVPVV